MKLHIPFRNTLSPAQLARWNVFIDFLVHADEHVYWIYDRNNYYVHWENPTKPPVAMRANMISWMSVFNIIPTDVLPIRYDAMLDEVRQSQLEYLFGKDCWEAIFDINSDFHEMMLATFARFDSIDFSCSLPELGELLSEFLRTSHYLNANNYKQAVAYAYRAVYDDGSFDQFETLEDMRKYFVANYDRRRQVKGYYHRPPSKFEPIELEF